MHAIILAGGYGKRLWPLSTKENPKQCLKLLGKKTLIEQTKERIEKLVPKENIFVSTNESIADKIRKILPNLNYVVEPEAKNTAPAIGLSAMKIYNEDKESVVIVETSDHYYKDDEKFINHLKLAVKEAKNNRIVTLGINPTYPSTGFGYIKKGSEINKKTFSVEEFKEKPDKKTAQKYVESKKYLWNSGIFVFKAKTMIKEIKKHMPDLHKGLVKIKESNFKKETIKEVFSNLESISIDYGIMEKTQNLSMIQGDFLWYDVGSFTDLEKIMKNENKDNLIISGNYINLDSKNNIIYSDSKKPTGTVNINNSIIINTKNGLLVCPKGKSQKVKKLVNKLKKDLK